ncbi:Ig-like domain-containing protein, partial [Opitutales bacterium]|nr:Ig-like domain-containing protein [Opitutales bacterium]
GSTDDFDAIQAAVDAALAAGGGIVRFDGTKTYRIIGNETGDNDVERVFDLEGAFNIKIEGNGAELVLHAPDSLAYITYCENIQMDGFTVRFDPLPYYQGTIDAIDVANLTMDITVPARYPEPEVGTDTVPQSHPFFARSFIPEAPGARAGSGYHLYIDSTETIGGDPRKIRLNFTNGFTNNEGESSNMTDNLQATLDEGATEMVVPHVRYGHRGHHNIVVSHSSRVKLSNILYRNTPFFLCAPVSNLGPVTIANFDVLTADPANELFVTWRDGFHVKDNAYGLTIEDGDWHGGAMNDDLFNFAHMMKQVTAVSGSELSLVAAASFGGQHIWHAGDWISVWDPTQTILRGRARIVGPGSAATWAATLTLDREIAATVDDWVVNDSRSNRGMLVRDCTNHRLGTRSGSARFRTPAVRFENDHFDGVYFHLHSTTVHEGPVPRDYHFEDTYFKGSMSSLAEPIAVTAGEDIVFKNCTVDEGAIMGRDGSDLSLDGVDWINQSADVLDLRDNTVGYVYNQSTRNASEVLLADVSLDSSSLVFFEEARFLQGLSPTTGVFPFANLLAIFNDPIQVGSGDIIVRNLTDGIDTRIQITDTSQVSVIGRELRIDPVADLIAGKDYAVLIEAGALLDENGVALDGFSSESTWTFTVLDPATANIVLNGDFADNASGFTTYPGYVGFGANATSIPGWSYSNTGVGNKGINGDGIHTPFSPSNRSAVTYFAFLQHGSSQFSQDLTGRLAPNSRYRISFKAANRNGDSSALGQVAVGDDSTTFYDSSVQSWSTAAFQSVTAEFTTGASFDGSVQVTLRNATDESVGGVTVNYSDVEIVKIDSYAVWVETYPSLDLSDPNGDLEPDGIPHHMEFALGGHPNVDDADTIMPTHHSDGNSLNFIFRRADLAIGSDHEPYTAYSLNLLDWYPVTHGANGMTLSVNDDGAATGVDEVTVEVDYEQADQERMFLRLVVP